MTPQCRKGIPSQNDEYETPANPQQAPRVRRDPRDTEGVNQEYPFGEEEKEKKEESRSPQTPTRDEGTRRDTRDTTDTLKKPGIPSIEDRIDKKKKKLKDVYIGAV